MNFSPELTGIGKYSGEMAEWLTKRGHDVRVITTPPFYPERKVWEGYAAFRYRKEHVGDSRVYRCPVWVPKRPSGIQRVFHLCSFTLSSFPVLLRQALSRPDVILVVEPPVMTAPQALFVGWLTRTRTWLHVQDFEVDAAFDLNLLPSFLRPLALRVERIIMRRFDRVSTLTDNMLDRLSAKGVKRGRAALFPNWVDAHEIHPLEGPNALRRELGFQETHVVALYAGSMGQKQGLGTLVEVAKRLRGHPVIRFVFCGQGSGRDALLEATRELGNVSFLPLQPADRLNELLNLADIHLLPQRADAADLMMPSKLTGMLASGRPTVAGAGKDTALGRMVEGKGLVVEPENSAAMAEALVRLAADDRLREAMGSQARQYAMTELHKDKILEQLETRLQELVR